MNKSEPASRALDIAELPDSAPLLREPKKLRERWQADGVLYFRDVISHAAIARVREEYLARLKELDVVAEQETQPVWNGRDRVDGTLARTISDSVWRELVADPSFDGLVRTFLGGAPAWVPIVVHRTAPPLPRGAEFPTFSTRHQDGVYNYGIDFITCWVPLMDIDDEIGGLAVVPGSHKHSLYPANAFNDPAKRVGIPAGVIPDSAWRRPNYKTGDLLMFHSMTAHAGLPNRSDKLRLSMDIRFLPETVAKPHVGQVTSVDGGTVTLKDEEGDEQRFVFDAETVVRGPKGQPLLGEERSGVVFVGADLIVVPDEDGRAKLIRSVSRKYVDLPAAWFETLPARWVP